MNRRDVLALSGAAALGGLAGCTGLLGDDGDGEGDLPTVPDEELPPVADWIPARAAIGLGDGDEYGFASLDLATLRSESDRIPGRVGNRLPSPPPEGIQRQFVVRTGAVDVVVSTGTFGAEEALEGIDPPDDASSETRGNYTVLQAENSRSIVSVTDGAIVLPVVRAMPPSSVADQYVRAFEAVVDADEGNARRLVDDDETARTLLAELDGGVSASGQIAPWSGRIPLDYGVEGVSALGESIRLDDDVSVEQVVVYRNEEVPDGLAEAAAKSPGSIANAGDRTASADGRVARVEGTAARDDLTIPRDTLRVGNVEKLAADYVSTPEVSFDTAYEGSTLTITHRGGDELTDENTAPARECDDPGLAVVVGGGHRACWPTGIAEGDAIDVEDVSGRTVELVWESPVRDRRETLLEHEVPD